MKVETGDQYGRKKVTIEMPAGEPDIVVHFPGISSNNDIWLTAFLQLAAQLVEDTAKIRAVKEGEV